MPHFKTKTGFTLLEVLVALAVLAIALAAIIKAAGDNAEALRYLRDKTLAHWVADNVLTDLQVRREWLAPGQTQGSDEMGQREWFWTVTVSNTIDDQLRRVEVAVFLTEERNEPVTALIGFIGQI